jgi:hypothetical protein
MAESTVQSNNAKIEFRGKAEHEMPVVSKAQNAAMHSAAEGHSTLGIPAKVGKEFVAASHGKSIKKLPKHVRKAAKRGLISPKQMAKMHD